MNNKMQIETNSSEIEEQIAKEVAQLKQFDPDKELKEEFEIISLHDLQKYLDE